MSRALLCLSLCAVSACRGVDVPTPPDTGALVSAYAAPTAQLTREVAREVAVTLLPEAGRFVALEGVAVVSTVAGELAEGGEGGPDTDLPQSALIGDGVFELEVICPGPGRRLGTLPPPGEDAGRLRALLTFTPRRIGSVAWGRFERCRFGAPLPRVSPDGQVAIEEVDVEIDADVVVFLGPDGIRLGSVPGDVLVEVDGRIALGGDAADVALDFRLRRSGALEVRFDVPGGDGHVLFLIDDGGRVLGVRDSERVWVCDFQQRVCVNVASGERLRF